MSVITSTSSGSGERSTRFLRRPIEELVARAADVIGPVWPLKHFIAVNPLQGLEGRPFEEAVAEAERQRMIRSDGAAGRESVNREMIKWCTAFFDEGQAAISMPLRASGLYNAFRSLAPFDGRLRISGSGDAVLAALPASASDAIDAMLDRLRIPEECREDFLRQSLAALPGWSGYVKWLDSRRDSAEGAERPAAMLDYLAVRLVLTCILWPDGGWSGAEPAELPEYLAKLPSSEGRFRDWIVRQIVSEARGPRTAVRQRAEAQLVFCIDVRSEPFRRAVEYSGDYETLGFAGFFGLPVRVSGLDGDESHDSCPVLLKAQHEVREDAVGSDAGLLGRRLRRLRLTELPSAFYQWLKYNFVTPFALVEMLGPWFGLRMLGRTMAPSWFSGLGEWARSSVIPPVRTEPSLAEISLSQRADFGESALRMMGLTENLAPLVVFCGHGSTTTNNAYASALDCGACGGHHGGPNARILAAILNDDRVRAKLADRGLRIPSDTLFLAGEHDTTTDGVELFEHPCGIEHRGRIARLRRDLAAAGMLNAQSRCQSMGLRRMSAASAAKETRRRSRDWSEVRPEWGLAGNAAFVVGPRELTRELKLGGRCFLHSYDWESDASGKFLTTILTAPMVVAQWINSQYLFSSVDNASFGSGSKVTQNVVGKIGVMQGNASDLMHGLPLQSVNLTDQCAYHVPLRLLTLVCAPRGRVDAIVRKEEVLRKLFGNGWVSLVCVEPGGERVYSLNRDLTWEEYCLGPTGAEREVLMN